MRKRIKDFVRSFIIDRPKRYSYVLTLSNEEKYYKSSDILFLNTIDFIKDNLKEEYSIWKSYNIEDPDIYWEDFIVIDNLNGKRVNE